MPLEFWTHYETLGDIAQNPVRNCTKSHKPDHCVWYEKVEVSSNPMVSGNTSHLTIG